MHPVLVSTAGGGGGKGSNFSKKQIKSGLRAFEDLSRVSSCSWQRVSCALRFSLSQGLRVMNLPMLPNPSVLHLQLRIPSLCVDFLSLPPPPALWDIHSALSPENKMSKTRLLQKSSVLMLQATGQYTRTENRSDSGHSKRYSFF